MRSKRKRYSALPSVTLPVLIECDLQKSDGFIFRRRYLGEPTNDNDFLPVRVLPLAVLKSIEKHKSKGKLKTRYGTVSQRTRTTLLTVNLLVQAIHSADEKRLNTYIRLKAAKETSEGARQNDLSDYGLGDLLSKDERERLEPEIQKQVLVRVKGKGHPIAELSAELYQIAPSQLVLWWRSKERGLAAGIYCSSLDAALFALLLSRVAMPQGTAICSRCQRVFIRSRIAQKFCSRRCGNAVRQTQWRAKQKENVRDAPLFEAVTRP
jgi:hypothetical protein